MLVGANPSLSGDQPELEDNAQSQSASISTQARCELNYRYQLSLHCSDCNAYLGLQFWSSVCRQSLKVKHL